MDSNSRRCLRVDLCHASPAKVRLFLLPLANRERNMLRSDTSGILSMTVSGPSLDIVAVAVNKIFPIFTTDPNDAGVAADLGGAFGRAFGNA